VAVTVKVAVAVEAEALMAAPHKASTAAAVRMVF